MYSILIVSSSSASCLSLREKLDKSGFSYVIAGSCKEASSFLCKERFGLVILNPHLDLVSNQEFMNTVLAGSAGGKWQTIVLGRKDQFPMQNRSSQNQLDDALKGVVFVDENYTTQQMIQLAKQLVPLAGASDLARQRLEVLVASSDHKMAEALKHKLEVPGLVLHACSSAQRARELISQNYYDLFVVDEQLDDDNGATLSRWISKHAFVSEGRIVHCGDWRGEQQITAALSVQADDYVSLEPGLELLVARANYHAYRLLAERERRLHYHALRLKEARDLGQNEKERLLQTTQALNAELDRKNRELERAWHESNRHSRLKSAFLATISHEIRTPLNAVNGFIDLMSQANLNAEQRDWLEVAQTSSNHMLTFISELLDMERLDAGQSKLDNRPLYLRSIFEQSLATVIPRASQKSLDLAYWIDPALPPTIVGDRTRIGQVLTNLLNNAVKYTESGGVSVRADLGGNGQSQIHIAVLDSGVGIQPQRLETVFDEYSRIEGGNTFKEIGTGLGLPICRRLVALMGGKIWAKSEIGLGTCMHVLLPLVAAQDDNIVPEHALGQPLRGRKVMTFGPQNLNRDLLALFVRNWGGECWVGDSLDQAVQQLKKAPGVDLVIADVMLGDLDPQVLVKTITEAAEGDATPLILVKPSCFDLVIEQANVHVLSKPIRERIVREALDNALGTKAPHQEKQLDEEDIAGMRVLIIDDNVVNHRIIGMYLKGMGVDFTSVYDGLAAMKILAEQPFDVLLMDVNMPGPDGIETTQMVRRILPAANQPYIVALTGAASKGDRDRCMDEGMDDFLTKPVSREQLAASLGAAGNQSQQAAQSPKSTAELAICDRPTLSSLAGHIGIDGLQQLVEAYVDDAERGLKVIEDAKLSGDSEMLRAETHTIKSTARYLGASQLGDLAEAIERMIKQGDNQAAFARVDELYQVANTTNADLKRLLDGSEAWPEVA